jgi:hypothetical protein
LGGTGKKEQQKKRPGMLMGTLSNKKLGVEIPEGGRAY